METAAAHLPRRPNETRWRGILLALGLLACAAYLGAELYLLSGRVGLPLDDSWIHLQFARNLAQGHGLSYNPGEPVTGSTAPLWTALVSLLFLLPGDPVVGVELLGVALYLVGVDATYRLARELELEPVLAALAAGLTLATSWLVWSALSGMEVPLFVVLSLWGMILHLRERREPSRPPLSLAVLGLAVLARPEGALLVLLAVVDRALRPRCRDGAARLARPPLRPLAIGLLLAAAAVAGPLAYYAWVGGSVLPTTFAVKGSGLRRLLPEPRYLYVILGIFFRSQPWMSVFAGAGALTLLERWGGRRDRGLLPALWLAALPLAYSLVSPLGEGLIAGNFGRYYFPLFPVLAVVGTLGLARAAEALPRRLEVGRGRLPVGAIAALVLLWPTVSDLAHGVGRYVQSVANVRDSDVQMAHLLADRLPPRAVLAVNDIGAIKYLLPNRVIDLAGIVTPEIRAFVARRRAQGTPFREAMLDFLAEKRPDYVVVFPSWLPGLEKEPGYRPLLLLKIRDNTTMGGDEMVLYRTPWTRYPLLGPATPAAAPVPAGVGDNAPPRHPGDLPP